MNTPKPHSAMRTAKIIVMGVLVLLFTILVVQNTDVVTVQLFAWEVTMSQIILLVLTLLAGFILGYFTAHGSHRSRKRQRAESDAIVDEKVSAQPTQEETTLL